MLWASQLALVVKNLPANVGDTGEAGSIPESEWFQEKGMKWQPTLVFLP